MNGQHILIVDDEEAVCWSLRRAFERHGHRVTIAVSAEDALKHAEASPPDAVILDFRLPGLDGLAALAHFRRVAPDAPIIIITAHGTLSTAVRAVEEGAFDYLPKPFDLSQALETVQRALLRRTGPRPSDLGTGVNEEIIGRSAVFQNVFKRIALVAGHDACVLITGESGTGKELVARAIHRHSKRQSGPFLPVHVAALNPNLVESELFGHVRGAFTGASGPKPGLLVLADGGTVFLDELADIPLPVQAKLLRVLERREVLPVGGNRPVAINIRILSATHRDLAEAVRAEQFRHDLYYRLNVFNIHLPSLRERPEDIPLLTEYFLRRLGHPEAVLPPATAAYLRGRRWPGNVRELRNALEHAVIVARGGVLLPTHFPPELEPMTGLKPALVERMQALVREWVGHEIERLGEVEPANLHEDLLRVVEPALLKEVLSRANGNRVTVARMLGLARGTVRKLIRRYIAPDETETDDEEQIG